MPLTEPSTLLAFLGGGWLLPGPLLWLLLIAGIVLVARSQERR